MLSLFVLTIELKLTPSNSAAVVQSAVPEISDAHAWPPLLPTEIVSRV
jgi:hypothetical protein